MPRLWWGVILLAVMGQSRAAEVRVRVLNVADGSGSVRVEVCRADEWLKGCILRAHAPAHAGITEVVVPDVPPGTYGVVAHHDSDDDTEVNRNFLGLPTEGIGFSRGATIRFGAPEFAAAALQVSPAGAVVPITLQFER